MKLALNRVCGILLGVALSAPFAGLAGCRDNSPPPPRVPVPSADNRDPMAVREVERRRPLPPQDPYAQVPPPPFDDVPLVNQTPPEQPAFVDAYRRVGSPRIVVFVNRTLDGRIIPVKPHDPVVSVEHTRRSDGPVTVERRDEAYRETWRSDSGRESTDRYESTGPAEYRETTEVYLRPGQYDEALAKSLDYEAIENILTDWLAADGQVTIISPTMARQRLTDQQVKELQEGRPQVLSELAGQLGADVLVQVQSRPTRQTHEGLEIRIVAEALNTRGGEQIGRAVVDVLPPLQKTTINHHTRFVARKLMDQMTRSWSSPPPQRPERPADRTPPPAERTTPPQENPPARQEPPRQEPPQDRSLPPVPDPSGRPLPQQPLPQQPLPQQPLPQQPLPQQPLPPAPDRPFPPQSPNAGNPLPPTTADTPMP